MHCGKRQANSAAASRFHETISVRGAGLGPDSAVQELNPIRRTATNTHFWSGTPDALSLPMTHLLRKAVTHYIDHLQDVPWIESLVAEHGVAAILQACVDVLGGQPLHPAEVHEVTTLLRDLGIRGIFGDELVAEVRERLPGSVLPALRPLLRAPVLQVRMAAIYTLGKLSFPEEAAALREVFPSYLDRDPFCLARLLGELGWLGDRPGVHARIEQLIAHQSPLVRWSALGYLDSSGTPSGPELALTSRWLGALASDPSPWVADEARHQLARLELEVAAREDKESPRAEQREKRRALNQAEPAITFSTLEIRFLNELHRTGQADYSLEELAAFVQTRD